MNPDMKNLKKKKKRIENLIQYQKGVLDKFIMPNKKDVTKNTINKENNDEIIVECQENVRLNDIVIETNIIDNNLNHVPTNIYDLGRWDNIDNALRDLLKKWLIYSKDFDKVYCFCCKLFGIKSCTNKIGNDGTKDWKNLGAKLKSHETSVEHISNMNSWIDLEMRLLNNKTIDKDMQEQISKEKEHWRQVLKRIIVVVKNLAKNNLAFHGTNEKIYQHKFDPIMKEHLKNIQNGKIHNHYLGRNIQNELVQILALEVKNTITKKIIAKYFSIILDCTLDISHHEQMSLEIRCVDISTSPINIKEYFLEFLKNLELDVNDIKGHGYDNRSNMKGKYEASTDINPLALYTHCGCHSLNLVLCDIATSCPKAVSFFGVLQRIYLLFSSSPKRWKILQNNLSSLTVKSLSQTRWESRIESVKVIRFQASKIRDALLEFAKVIEDPKIKSEFEFLCHIDDDVDIRLVMIKILITHIKIAMDQLKGFISFFERYREHGFTNAMIMAKEIANELEIEPKFVKNVQFKSFRIEYFVYIIDQSLFSLKSRFEQIQMYESIFRFLFNFKRLKALEDVLKRCCRNLQDSLKNKKNYNINGLDLFSELKVLIEILQKKNSNSIEILNYIKKS
ncbi:hypothetical protein UlMin_025101 [Ulmus minor]